MSLQVSLFWSTYFELIENYLLYYLSKFIHQFRSIMNSELTEEVKTINNDVAGSNKNIAASLKSQSMLGEDQDNEDSLRKDSVEKPEKYDNDSEDIGDEVNEKDNNYRPFLMEFAGFKRDGEDDNECEKHIRTYVKNSSLCYYSASSSFDVVDIYKGVSNAPKFKRSFHYAWK